MMFGADRNFRPTLVNPVPFKPAPKKPLALLVQWIQGPATSFRSFTDWQLANFGSTTNATAQPAADPDGDGLSNRFEFLTRTGANSAVQRWSYRVEQNGGQTQLIFPRVAGRQFRVHVSPDLRTWSLWNVPGNHAGYSATDFEDIISGPFDPLTPQFFRFEIDDL
jgi:hypothetical protein